MNMKKSLLLLFLLIIPLVIAQPENYNDRSSLVIDYDSNGEINLEGSDGFGSLSVLLYLFPKESSRQEVINLAANPAAQKSDEEILFTWNEFLNQFEYSIDSQVKTKNNIYPISPMDFPIKNLDQKYEEYLGAGEIIDITPAIVNKASEIIGGESDLYTATYKLGEWVNRKIDYDLNTVTAEAALKSSWVLENKAGVCDEITSLFISLARSVGIPARFVSGTAYSNLNHSFENHGWAEVYFPGEGWVPYDITFTQLGWLDPAHLALDYSIDAGQPSVKYSWRSRGSELDHSSFEDFPEILSTGEKIASPFTLELEPLLDQVGPGSYVPLKITIENSIDGYLTDSVTITKAPTMVENNRRPILLKPNQKKSSFWIVQVPKDLRPNYLYTAELEVKDMFEKRATSILEFSNDYEIITKKEAEEMVAELEIKEEKSYSEEVFFSCEQEKEYYYDIEDPKIICEIKNIGNTFLPGTRVCLEEDCVTKDLMIGVKEMISFENLPDKDILIITLQVNEINLLKEINPKIFIEPDVLITGVQYPKEVFYGEEFDFSFVLSSIAEINNIEIEIEGLEKLTIVKDQKAETVIIKTNSKSFITGDINIKLKYNDEFDRKFSTEKTFEITILNMPWYARFFSFFANLV
jgi:hypothetical protein